MVQKPAISINESWGGATVARLPDTLGVARMREYFGVDNGNIYITVGNTPVLGTYCSTIYYK